MRTRTAAIISGLLLALPLWAGEARAAEVCSDAPGTGDTIKCEVGSGTTGNVEINADSVTITAPNTFGVHAIHGEIDGTGSIDIDVTDSALTTSGLYAAAVFARHDGAGSIDIEVTDTVINTAGTAAEGVYGYRARGFGALSIRVSGGSITTTGFLGAGVRGQQAGAGSVRVHLTNGVVIKTGGGAGVRLTGNYGDAMLLMDGGSSIETTDSFGHGVYLDGASGHLVMDARDGSITTADDNAHGVYFNHVSTTGGGGGGLVRMKNFRIATAGEDSDGVRAIYALHRAPGLIVDLEDVSMATKGEDSRGFYTNTTGAGSIRTVFRFRGGSVTTEGDEAEGVYLDALAHHIDAGDPAAGEDAGGISGVDIRTKGRASHGVRASLYVSRGAGAVFLDFRDGSITTEGDDAHGVFADYGSPIGETDAEAKTVLALRGASVSTEGIGAAGVYVHHRHSGSVSMTSSVSVTVDAESVIKTPFGVAAEARLENSNSSPPPERRGAAADGVRVEFAGELEARDVGVLARAARSSGSTFQGEADEADGEETPEAAPPPPDRKPPLLHVETSGSVTVGEGVMDDFIRARIAGSDGALSAAERAVLSAVTAGDSDALEAALGALPEDASDDYKAQARELLRKRGHEPTGDFASAEADADGMLGLSRAGVRAIVQDYHALARSVAEGDVDPSLVPPARYWPPLSDEERETLAAQRALSAAERTVLEAALTGGDLETALAALPESYGDEYRNAVRSLAASYHEGGVRVDVTGGTIAAEGNGVEALYAIPHERNGAISVSVAEGASVSGGANGLYLSGAGAGEGNFPAQSVSIDGRVTGGSGAGVYLKGGGRLAIGATGEVGAASGVAILADGPGDFHADVAGRVDGDLRSEVDGDFTAIISGRVEGDLEGLGDGEHTVRVAPGGAVAGTIHLAASAVRLEGAAGRVRFDRGGTLMLGPGGRLAGLDGVAVESLGGAASRLRLSLELTPDRRVRDVLGGWVLNDGGGTDILVNGVNLHDAERGATGVLAAVGARNVGVHPSEIILDRDFSTDDFIDVLAPRAGLYEALPGLLTQLAAGGAGAARGGLGGGGGAPGGDFASPDSLVWFRLSGEKGSGRLRVGGKREFDRFEAEAGGEVPLPWMKGLGAWALIRLSEGSASVSMPAGRGDMDLEGLGLGAGFSWRSEDGWHVNGGLLTTEYLADFSSKSMGALKNNAGAIIRSLEMEAGRRGAFRSARLSFTPRVWLARSRLSMDSFTDAVGARFSLVRGSRLTGGAGVLAEAVAPLDVGGGKLDLRGSADVEEILSGRRTTVEVSGERFHSSAEKTRLLLGLGARWRTGRLSLDANLSAGGLGSGEKTYGGRLSLGARF